MLTTLSTVRALQYKIERACAPTGISYPSRAPLSAAGVDVDVQGVHKATRRTVARYEHTAITTTNRNAPPAMPTPPFRPGVHDLYHRALSLPRGR